MIHLDSHVITKPRKSVLKALEEKWGLLDTPHHSGIGMYPDVDEAMAIVLKCFEADGYRFQVTPGGFHAMQHLFLHFYLEEVRHSGRNHFLSCVTDEAPILKMLDRMEMMGCGIKLLPVDSEGRIELKALEESIKVKTSLLSISAVSAMTGVLQPIPEIVEICHAKGVKVHVNASHAIGTWGVSLQEWKVDYLSFDGDKIGTPQGLGGLFSRESIKESTFGIIPLARALKEVTEKQEAFAMETARLRAEFEAEIVRVIPDCQVVGGEALRVPHIFALSFPDLMNEALLYALYREKIDASIGGGQFQTLTALQEKCGKSDEGAISFALHEGIEEDQLAHVLDVLVKAVRNLRKMSVAL